MMTKPELRAAAQQYIQTNEQDIVRNIRRLVEINSVRGDALPGAPFGAGPRRALEEARTLARELGLCAELCADAMCVACVPGSGAQTVGIIAHLDVVPEGNGWASPPFSLLEKEGYLIGRGVADDKGPAVLALYAAKFFADLAKETGTAPRHGI
ncbi:MAG: M20/M25/M40 family metallo-hydrolase, partial [Pygmaiobacter sp.]